MEANLRSASDTYKDVILMSVGTWQCKRCRTQNVAASKLCTNCNTVQGTRLTPGPALLIYGGLAILIVAMFVSFAARSL